jgi:3-deoxy-D-manno-octulosonate 8-phosphate phosphatase (KDO 8-P phosphatase)
MPGESPALAVPGSLLRSGALEAARRVRFLVLDVDGVCTDGKLYFFENGRVGKAFSSQDGLGIKTALRAGIGVGVITGRDDDAVRARMSQLGVTEYHPGHESKLPALDGIRARLGLDRKEMAYLGDDWIDLDPMRAVGFPMAVANARPEVMAEALYVTAARGGEGAVREAVELLLAARPASVSPVSLWTLEAAWEGRRP